MILHNYVHVLEACDRVSMIQDGVIALDKPTAETSVEELTEIVVNEYRRAREAAHGRRSCRQQGVRPASGCASALLARGPAALAGARRAARGEVLAVLAALAANLDAM